MSCLDVILNEVFGGDRKKLQAWIANKGGKNPELAAKMWIRRHNAYHGKYNSLVQIAKECQKVVDIMEEMMKSPLLAHLPEEELKVDQATLEAARKGLARAEKAVKKLSKYQSPITNC